MTNFDLPNRGSAREYDLLAARSMATWDVVLLERAATLCPSKSCSNPVIVDVGTGTGLVPIALARDSRFNGYTFIGIDRYEDMSETALTNIRLSGIRAGIHICVGDACALPLPDQSVDLVISRATLHHLQTPARALQEMYRVLAPEGVALIHDLRRDAPASAIQAFNRCFEQSGYGPTRLSEKLTLSEAAGLLTEAGLSDRGIVEPGPAGPAEAGFEIRLFKL